MKNIEAIELGQQIFRDQTDWLDKTMREIVPPKFHHLISEGNVDDERIQKWLLQNSICIHFYVNNPLVRISRRGVFTHEFNPVINIDGRPVDHGKIIARDQFAPEDIWADDK